MRGTARSSPAAGERRKPERDGRLRRWTLTAVAGIVLSALLLGFAFAGSSNRIAEGVHVAGVDVGGMTPADASALLERRFDAVARVPVTFVAGERRWRVTPRRIGVEVDWRGALEIARRQSGGFGPFRGLRRLQTRVFGVDVAPPVQVYDAALRFELRRFADEVRRPRREAAIRLRGLVPVVIRGQSGRVLDERAAAGVVVRALAAPVRPGPVQLPVRLDPPRVTAEDLRPEVERVRTALSAPVRLTFDGTRWRLPRWRIAQLLALPRGGERRVRIGGAAAARWLAALARNVDAEPRDATFVASGDRVTVVPERDGRRLDRSATAANLLRAALSRADRFARVVVRPRKAERTAAEAEAMGIDRVMASYTTLYAGSPDRIRNLQLAVTAIDGTVVPPGGTFSFNDVVGERTEEKGYRPAPVIVAGEYEEAVGGGVSQVATTVFNAAWEAGLRIVERNPHALYIDRYELGRDATVNYPNLDLRFVNDTRHWVFLRGAYGETGIAISIYGGETRRVETIAGEVKVTAPPPVRSEPDPTLERGTEVVEEEGTDARTVSVRRIVYDSAGRVLRDEWWRTSYRGEYRIVRVGTKPPPPPALPPEEPEEKPKPDPEEEPSPPTTTGTVPAATTPATTTASATTTQP